MVVACTYNPTLRRLRQDFCKFEVKLATQQVLGQYNIQSKALSLKKRQEAKVVGRHVLPQRSPKM